MCRIQFDQLSIHQVSKSSGVFQGTNFQSGFKAHARMFEGNGKVVGHRNSLLHNKHLIMKRPSADGD
ncbi:hypothetical protein GLW04_09980 [Halobacillus litoralis]|uniref:Uncharacterized protein n=1 Tax=Halobacillus litoralis TaxID=45668 RepID=A0A845DUM8_9BACI|nr:hypothetical protein [Halobacillus litoralis]MYL20215.1 hypothetical protein [Halobacillus litoralis]